MKRRYFERYDTYHAAADDVIKNDKTALDAVNEIERLHSK